MNKNKGETMNNLKKLGLSALAGSLVAVSAQAGEMAVTGSANVTYVQKTGTHGTSIGTDKDVSFTGSGELDNGWNFVVSTTLTDAYEVSSSYTSITMGSMGTVSFGADTGGASGKYDEEVPQAYEQTSDGQQNSANVVGNAMDSNMIVYNSPSFESNGATVSYDLEYSPSSAGAAANDGGTAATGSSYENGFGLGVTAKYDQATIGAYATTRENTSANLNDLKTTGNDTFQDDFQMVGYAKYAMGPVSVGYSLSYHDSGLAGADEATTTAKVVNTALGIFEAESMSIAFNVNDNLSVSYTTTDDTYDMQGGTGYVGTEDVIQKTDAIQVAYSMGAMSIKAYSISTKKPGYDNDALDVSKSEVALGLSF